MILIGVTGPKYSGKDTVADMLVNCTGMFRKASFATPIKDMAMTGLGLTHDQVYGDLKEVVDPRYGRTPRNIMQTLGTEWGRRMVCEDIWARALFVKIKSEAAMAAEMYRAPYHTVIADVRFDNEADLIREQGGWIIHIEGRDLNTEGSDHASEAGVEWHHNDMVLDNSGDIQALRTKLSPIINRLNEELRK
jgi:hypothetical protein